MMDFNQKAAGWDTPERIKRSAALSAILREELGEGIRGRGLDFGCGTGLMGFALADLFAEITMVDSSCEMIRILTDKIREAGMANLHPICLDVVQGDALPEAYDVIFSSMVLHHILSVDGILATLLSALKPGGTLLILDLCPDAGGRFHQNDTDFTGHHGFEPESLVHISRRVGYERAEARVVFRDVRVINGEEVPYALFLLRAEKGE